MLHSLGRCAFFSHATDPEGPTFGGCKSPMPGADGVSLFRTLRTLKDPCLVDAKARCGMPMAYLLMTAFTGDATGASGSSNNLQLSRQWCYP